MKALIYFSAAAVLVVSSLPAAASTGSLQSRVQGQVASAQLSDPAPAGPKIWVYDDYKLVVAAYSPTLNINVYKLEVDDTTYAQMNVTLAYVSADLTKQGNALSQKYPGYNVQKVILQKGGTYHLTIPTLGVDEDVETTLSQEGPVVSYTQFLSKAQYKKVHAELVASRSLATVTGGVKGTVPVYRVVEHQEVDGSFCATIAGSETTAGALSVKLSGISKLVNRSSDFKYDSTRERLVSDIQKNCFEIAQSTTINSFGDLLAVVLHAKNPGRPLVGETTQKVLELQDIPLTFETIQKEGN